MKTRYVVLVLLSFIMFSNISCDEDDIFPQNEEDPLFTSTNYIYEGDLRKYYLESENTRLNDSIAVWQQIPDSDPAYDITQNHIAEAYATIETNDMESDTIVSPTEAFLIINPIPPIPPAPSPCLCLIVNNTIGSIALQPGTNQMSLTITSTEDEETLVNTTPNSLISTIPDTNNTGMYQPFQFGQEGFIGEAMISVQTENNSYSFLADFYTPQ
ncbi:hypothetical protein Q4512_03955 [Oceanihabitans sp. 2_MG-2023]|uniref:hypothetical protein n=1 Tax=Oceanihabitans sp. 2_MG-2023 TaxID=3062661 RepID=UPI0026E22D3D|nr:hypothetical protein [Oceanihabitans sp. 2_MG-2023]MDO6596055.1 hypothetical protein [Oceanihabitans sp. 2_MG-2023]